MGLFHTLLVCLQRGSSAWLHPETLPWPSPSHGKANFILRCAAQALPRYGLGRLPWGAASPGAGPDLHAAHIQIPAKMNWLHSTPTTYMRKKMRSAVSGQLLCDPFTPLGDSVGRHTGKGAVLQGPPNMSKRVNHRGHQLVSLPFLDSQLMKIWVWPISGHLQLKKHPLRLCKVWVIRGLRSPGTSGRLSLLPAPDLFLLREEDMVETRDRRASRVDARSFYARLNPPRRHPSPRYAPRPHSLPPSPRKGPQPLPTFRMRPWVAMLLLFPSWGWAGAAFGPKAAPGQQPSQQHSLHGAEEEQQQQDGEVVNWGRQGTGRCSGASPSAS